MPTISAATSYSNSSSPSKGRRPRAQKLLSASQIAHDVNRFETWATHQNLVQASFQDMPDTFSGEVAKIFGVDGRIPLSWTVEGSKGYKSLCRIANPAFIQFIQTAYEQSPSLFTNADSTVDTITIFPNTLTVFKAWQRLHRMLEMPEEKWTEADFVSNVYSAFRNGQIENSGYRVQRPVALAQPVFFEDIDTEATRILMAKKAIPDCTVHLPVALLRELQSSVQSPYNRLKTLIKSGNPTKSSSFRFQSTPFMAIPEVPGFECISSIWEDKKQSHNHSDAYRQNRMSTTSATRHLHSLKIEAPVIGLIWGRGEVCAHVDWCTDSEDGEPKVLSAPYLGIKPSPSLDFHRWRLDRPADILQVSFLIKNIDSYNVNFFHESTIRGIDRLLSQVDKGVKYRPWRRSGDLLSTRSQGSKENTKTPRESLKDKRRKK